MVTAFIRIPRSPRGTGFSRKALRPTAAAPRAVGQGLRLIRRVERYGHPLGVQPALKDQQAAAGALYAEITAAQRGALHCAAGRRAL